MNLEVREAMAFGSGAEGKLEPAGCAAGVPFSTDSGILKVVFVVLRILVPLGPFASAILECKLEGPRQGEKCT